MDFKDKRLMMSKEETRKRAKELLNENQVDLITKYIFLEQQCKKQKEVINKAIELLGNYKHYSTPDEKQNGDNEDLVNNAFDILKEVE